ncbi:MAG: bifunctional folylpolyglutamate synthase/dihydrofolate synthase [Pseudomonadota bacterium]|nr:MAG: bifunctional folylpolyglutamate synthase/dihydrofolate synthase [Pseudomonadota bacterium]
MSAWLDALERRSPQSRIVPGLERVATVAERLAIGPGRRPVITIGGTNGKGSVVAMCESMLVAAGHRPLAYTSPHVHAFAERMRIGGVMASESAIVESLEAVEAARAGVDLTYFEHITLAAMVLGMDSDVDAWLLEVGLGGRLDAVNVVDADIAIITSIGLDHADWLGSTRSAIGREKAGIARAGRPVIVGEPRPPSGLLEALHERGARIFRPGRHWAARRRGSCSLRPAALPGDWQLRNAACAAAALALLEERLPVDASAMARGLRGVCLPGRFERFDCGTEVIVDVAHNPHAARGLARMLEPSEGRSVAVFSALADKDVTGIARPLQHCFDAWFVASSAGDRGQSGQVLASRVRRASVTGRVETVESVAAALQRALAECGQGDRIVVFGSFRTVAEAWPLIKQHL